MQVSLSGVANNDPDNDVCRTTAKRLLPSSIDCDDSFHEMESTQLSTTKSMMTIQKSRKIQLIRLCFLNT